MSGELLEFPGEAFGMALNLEEDNVGAVILGSDREIGEGDVVKPTGTVVQIPAGEAMIGRVVDALGPSHRRQGSHRDHRKAAGGISSAGRSAEKVGQRAAADRHQSHRRYDAHRQGSA